MSRYPDQPTAMISDAMTTGFPISVPAIRIEQPLGAFYAVALPSSILLQVCYAEKLAARLDGEGLTYLVDGVQRDRQERRLRDIAKYIDRTDSAFPNSVILAANYTPSGHLLGESENDQVASAEVGQRWSVEEKAPGSLFLTIPSAQRLAAVVDGQHRLFAFALVQPPRREVELLCAVYMDLPRPFQAQLFATINSTQKPVDKSLTYELFGYNVDEEPPSYWSPDKLAVFLTRRLGAEESSPLHERITVSPENEFQTAAVDKDSNWRVSTAVVVQGIVRLFSSDPKRDSNFIYTVEGGLPGSKRPRSDLQGRFVDRSPLREMYIEGNDALIDRVVRNFIEAVDTVLWTPAKPRSFIKKTVGVQALFDLLRRILPVMLPTRDLTERAFAQMLEPAAASDFSEERFRSPSGAGRSLIRRELLNALGLKP